MLLRRKLMLSAVTFSAVKTVASTPLTYFSTPTTTLSPTIASEAPLLDRQVSPTPTTPPAHGDDYFISTKFVVIDGFTNSQVTKHPQTITIAIPTCIKTITPDHNGYVPPGTCGALYNYYPNFEAALVTGILFGLLSVAHITLAAMYKKGFCWVIIMGTLWEAIAFLVRAASTKQQQNTGLVLVSQLFVLLVPLWINAFIYILLSHLINFVSPTSSILGIPAAFLSIIFVILDFVSFVVQMIGGMLAGPTASNAEKMKGIHIYMGGIGLQQFFIVIFVGIAIRFHLEMQSLQRAGRFEFASKEGWERLLWAVYIGLVFITIRIIYRLVEFSGGHDPEANPLPYKEIYLYVLEVLPVFFAVVVYIVIHPGKVLVGPDAEMPGIWKIIRGKAGRNKYSTKLLEDDGVELIRNRP